MGSFTVVLDYSDYSECLTTCRERLSSKMHGEDQVEVKIGKSVLQKQKSVLYLGVTVDKHLHWHLHIDTVQKMCLGKIAPSEEPVPISQVTLYLSFVLPHLEYCSVVWNNSGATLTSRLECVQNYHNRSKIRQFRNPFRCALAMTNFLTP